MTKFNVLDWFAIPSNSLIIMLVIGSAFIQMRKVENLQVQLLNDFRRYVDNTQDINYLYNQVQQLEQHNKEKENDYQTLHTEYLKAQASIQQLQKDLD